MNNLQMVIVDTSKSLLENLYYLSGILILISIIIGLYQLSLAKTTLKINSKREAATLGAQQAEIYMTRIVSLINQLNRLENEKGVKAPKIEIGDFYYKAILEKIGAQKYLQIDEERKVLTSAYLNVLNSLEAFSVYFIKEVADEEIAFSSVGISFTHTVESLYFDIAGCRRDDDSKYFQNIIKLYKLWKNRIKQEEMQKTHKELAEQIKKLDSKPIKPIGT